MAWKRVYHVCSLFNISEVFNIKYKNRIYLANRSYNIDELGTKVRCINMTGHNRHGDIETKNLDMKEDIILLGCLWYQLIDKTEDDYNPEVLDENLHFTATTHSESSIYRCKNGECQNSQCLFLINLEKENRFRYAIGEIPTACLLE
jgi:hypothetical protein